MGKPTLIIMAAGMGSRFGGLKQVAAVDDAGRAIMDYSAFDAARAGFDRVICVIKKEMEADFKAAVGDRLSKHLPIDYAYQSLDDLPDGFSVPEGRSKPWGTAHAVYSARSLVNEPFAVINADDFYGRAAFQAACDFLTQNQDERTQAMIAYPLGHTLTEFGSVSRGVCVMGEDGMLREIIERERIEKQPEGAAYTDDGEQYIPIATDTLVSMNFWAFSQRMMAEFDGYLRAFWTEKMPENPLKCEAYLPSVADQRIREGKIRVQVLPTSSRWYGMTYPDDLPSVRVALAELRAQGEYPDAF